MSEGAFFQDLALLMAVAGVVSAVFAKLKWPKVLGYIGAGIVLSRHTWGGGFLVDEASVMAIGQLGVVFLMFTMGLGFSTSQMRKLKSVTMPTAILDVVVMTWAGYTIGTRCLGWGLVPSLFLGAAICDSATTMLAKVVDELGWSDRPFTRAALGTSVCEDILCVAVISLITGVATGHGVSLAAVGSSLGGLFVFFLATIVIGFVLVPRLLVSIGKTRDDEALLLTLLGVGFLVTYIAYRFEFSLALGAFLVGILGSASDVRHRLQGLIAPLQSMFAAVFFVSIGLLVNPAECWRHAPTVLILSAAVVVVKTVNCTVGSLFSGATVKESVQMGMSLAQIGEFAFMVALLYVDITNDVASPMYQIVVAVSVLTTLANPFMIRWSEPAGEWVERHLPSRVRSGLEAYREMREKYASVADVSATRSGTRRCVIELAVLGVIVFAVAFSMAVVAGMDWSNLWGFFDRHKGFFFAAIFNLFGFGALWVAGAIARRLGGIVADAVVTGRENWHRAVRGFISVAIMLGVVAVFFLELSMLNITYLSVDEPWEQCSILVLVLVLVGFGGRRILRTAQQASNRFSEALSADERRAKFGEAMTVSVPAGTLHRLPLALGSPAVGGNVVSLDVRAKTGVTIVSVIRGGEVIRNVGPSLEFRAGDVLVALGEGSQIAALKDLLGITA